MSNRAEKNQVVISPAPVDDVASNEKAARKAGKPANEAAPVRTLIPASEVEGTAAHAAAHAEDEQPTFAPTAPAPREEERAYDADSVFAKLKPLSRRNVDEE